MALNEKLVLPGAPKMAMFPIDGLADDGSGLSSYLAENGATTPDGGLDKNIRITSILCTNENAGALNLRIQMIDPATMTAEGTALTIGETEIPISAGTVAGTKGIEVLKATEFADIVQADANSNEFIDMPAGSDMLFLCTTDSVDDNLQIFVRYYELDEESTS